MGTIKYNESLRKKISLSILNELDNLDDDWNNINEANKANMKLFMSDLENGGSDDYENRNKMLYIMHRFRDNAYELCALKDYEMDSSTKAYKWLINTSRINLANYVTNWKAFGGESSFTTADGVKFSTSIEDNDYIWKIFYKYGDKIPDDFSSAPNSGAGKYFPNTYISSDKTEYARTNEYLKNGKYRIVQNSDHTINSDYIVDGEAFYDDGRIFTASKIDVWNQVTNVVTRTYNTYSPFWPFHKKTVTESSVDVPLENNTRTTNPDPCVDDIDFDKLLKLGNEDTAYNWGKKCVSLLNLVENKLNISSFDEHITRDMATAPVEESTTKTFIVKNLDYTEEYADEIIRLYKPIKKTESYVRKNKLYSYDYYIYYNMFFVANDSRNYAVGSILSTKKKKIRKNIRPQYREKYEEIINNPTSENLAIKQFVYDAHDLYWEMGWGVEMEVLFTGVHTENNNKLVPTPYITDDVFIELANSYIEKVYYKILEAKGHYDESKNWFETVDEEPEKNYENFLKYFVGASQTKQDCILALRNIVENILPWIPKRTAALKTTIDYKEDLKIFPEVLKTRLNKSSGSLIQNYNLLVNQDSEMKKYYKKEKITEASLDKLLVARAADIEDEQAFNKTNYPRYIDIEAINTHYKGKKFNVGDIIYIMNDIYPEQQNRITYIKTWVSKKTDYSKFNGETGTGAIVNDVTITRLGLEKPLSNYLYISDEQENLITNSNLRVVKVLQ
jgi:hypothetical protein